MALSTSSRYSCALLLFLHSFASQTLGSDAPLSFTFERFGENVASNSAISLYGDAEVEDSAVRMSRPSASGVGKILYRKPFKFLRRYPGFSNYLCFSVSASSSDDIAFFLHPSHGSSNSVLSVEFVNNASDIHIGVRTGRGLSAESCNFSAGLSTKEKLHCWIDYDGFSKKMEVRLSKSRATRPSSPFISCAVDMSSVLKEEEVLVGISSSSDFSDHTNKGSSRGSYIYAWSFVVKYGAPYLLHSEPLDPSSLVVATHQEAARVHPRKSYSWMNFIAWLFGLVCGALMALVVVFVWSVIACRRPVAALEHPVHPVEVAYEKVVMVGENGIKNAQT
ncbi:L-type lectin-domain containing receptor kinase IV.1 [Apostasia shenzhenica]|uniref:L-type lectin-domain containing receptor kinase IV.1 n=1 Tax=Apostasia shenzhenica TaxID=1088818 RepID=A0A2H9ZS19_9ASPA|nr:L-type lectin-domain containing receptor kinase IV.1 [Apostasia shenzhenica]